MAPKINYHIKLMCGNNVVLVEANGYESEIFMPQIVNGRISFLNIIPNRRCCRTIADWGKKCEKCELTRSTPSEMPKLGRYSAGHDKENSIPPLGPLAMSTPAAVCKNSMGSIRIEAGTNTIATASLDGDSIHPTPEPMRRAAPVRTELAIDNSVYNIPRGIKVLRLYHNSSDGTPRKVGRLVSTTNGGSVTQEELHSLSRMTDVSSSFRIPSTPPLANFKQNGVVSSTPVNKKLATVTNQQQSTCKWRKCQTPKKTYSRRGNHAVAKHNQSFNSVKKPIRPSYLVNPTKAPEPTHKVELKKKRLKVDEQVRMTSKQLKSQQQQVSNVTSFKYQTESIRKSLNNLRQSKMSAFDLLTNSNRSRNLSTKLNEQFRKGCINKASSTYRKYKLLSFTPPLQQDEQILEITSTQGQSFEQSAERIGGRIETGENSACAIAQVVSGSTSTMLSVPVNNGPEGSEELPLSPFPPTSSTSQMRLVKHNSPYPKPIQQSTPINSENQGKIRSPNRHKYSMKL